jgi:hypothetical protein
MKFYKQLKEFHTLLGSPSYLTREAQNEFTAEFTGSKTPLRDS